MNDNNKTCDTQTKSENYDFSFKPPKARGWLGKVGICEVCGNMKATVNLNLKYGSHRECRYCWDHV